MSEPVAIAQVREHLRLDAVAADPAEDVYLTGLTIAARRACELRINRTIADPVAPIADDDLAVLVQAILLTVGTWYAHREGATTDARSTPAEVPLAVTWLLDPLKKWDDGGDTA